MGLLISINGADFEPYAPGQSVSPLVNRKKATEKVEPVRRDLDHPESFDELIDQKPKTPPHVAKKYEKTAKISEHETRRAIYARELMTQPVETIAFNQTIEKAKEILSLHGFRHLPVVDSSEKIVGILSDRNIALNKPKAPVKDVMSKDIIAGQPETLLRDIAEAMIEHKINSVPILNQDRQIVGIVTSTDILKSVLKNPNVDLLV